MTLNIEKSYGKYYNVIESYSLKALSRRSILLILYFPVVWGMAIISNPEYMQKSIGILDAVVRSHVYAIYQVWTLNLNPVYLVATLFPVGIVLRPILMILNAVFSKADHAFSVGGFVFSIIISFAFVGLLYLVFGTAWGSVYFGGLIDAKLIGQLFQSL